MLSDLNGDKLQGMENFCTAAKGTRLRSLNLANIGMGCKGLLRLSNLFQIEQTLSETEHTDTYSVLSETIEELDISDNDCLGKLEHTDSPSEIKEGWEAFCKALASCKLKRLAMKDLDMGPTYLKSFASFLLVSGSPFTGSIQEIDISCNPRIGSIGVNALYEQFQKAPETLLELFVIGPKGTKVRTSGVDDTEDLNYSGQDLGPAETSMVASFVISRIRKLKTLNISSNYVFGGTGSNPELKGGAYVLHPTGVTWWSPVDGKYKDHQPPWRHNVDKDQGGWETLCAALKQHRIEKLWLCDIGMGSIAIQTLAAMLLCTNTLQVLNLSGNNCFFCAANSGETDIKGWQAMCEALSHCPLKELNISDINLCPAGVELLARVLLAPTVKFEPNKLSDTLQVLNISGNKLFGYRFPRPDTPKPGRVMHREFVSAGDSHPHGVFVTPTRERLHDIDSDRGMKAWSALCVALAGCHIKRLQLADIGMGAKGFAKLQVALNSNWCSELQVLDISSNAIGIPGAEAMKNIYENSGSLKTMLGIVAESILKDSGDHILDMSDRGMDASNAVLLAAELQRKMGAAHGVNVLNISRNDIGEAATDIVAALHTRKEQGDLTEIKKVIVGAGQHDEHIAMHLQLGQYESESLDLSHEEMNAGDIVVLTSWWLPSVEANLSDVTTRSTGVIADQQVYMLKSLLSGTVETHIETVKDAQKLARTFSAEQQPGHQRKRLQRHQSSRKNMSLPKRHLFLASMNLGPGDIYFLSKIVSTFKQSCSGIQALVLDRNPLTGCHFHDGESWDQIDSSMLGFEQLCQLFEETVMPLEKISMVRCGIGPLGLIRFSKCIMSMKHLKEIVIEGNPIAGAELIQYSDDPIQNSIDSNLNGLREFCAALSNSNVSKLNVGDISDGYSVASRQDHRERPRSFLGPDSIRLFSDQVQYITTLNELTIGSTGDMLNQETYTVHSLQGGADISLDLRSKTLGPDDLRLLATLITSFERFAANICKLDISKNCTMGTLGVEAIAKALERAPKLQTIVIGPQSTQIPVLNVNQSATLHLPNNKFGPVEVCLIASIIRRKLPLIRNIKELTLDRNDLCSRPVTVGAAAEGASSVVVSVAIVTLRGKHQVRFAGAKVAYEIVKIEPSGFNTKLTLETPLKADVVNKTSAYVISTSSRKAVSSDTDAAMFASLCEACVGASFEKLSVSACNLDSEALLLAAKAMSSFNVLDISDNHEFGAFGHHESNIDGVSALAGVLSNSRLSSIIVGPKGTTLPVHGSFKSTEDFTDQQFGPSELRLLSSIIALNKTLKHITLLSTGISDEQRPYTIYFTPDKTLDWDMSKKNLGNWDLHFLAAAVASSVSTANLKHLTLNLDGNPITEGGDVDGLTALCKSFETLTSVELSISGCHLGSSGFSVLATAIPATFVQELDISNNPIGMEAAVALAETLPRATKLRGITIGAKGARIPVHDEKLSQPVRNMKGMAMRKKVLDLSDQLLEPPEILLVCSVLPLLLAVKVLDLSNNNIGTDGAAALVHAAKERAKLGSDSFLETIIIGRQPPKGKPLNLMDANSGLPVQIACSTNIQTGGIPESVLDFSGQSLGEAEIKMISEFVIPNSKKLDVLKLSSSGDLEGMANRPEYELIHISSKAAPKYDMTGKVLVDLSDRTLDLSTKCVGPADLQLIEQIIMYHKKFRKSFDVLDISNNPIGMEGAQAVIRIIQHCNTEAKKEAEKDTEQEKKRKEEEKEKPKTISLGKGAFQLPTQNLPEKMKAEMRDLGPAELSVLAHVLPRSGVKYLSLSKNCCFGKVASASALLPHAIDEDQRGWEPLCEAMATCELEHLHIDEVGMGPIGLGTFTKLLAPKPAFAKTLTAITLSSTGNLTENDGQKTYTLKHLQSWNSFSESAFLKSLPNTDTEAKFALSLASLNLGPADLSFLATVLGSFSHGR